jgi:pimeloyl-ACP methyl ester carboxylesterase
VDLAEDAVGILDASHRFNHPIAVNRTPRWRHRLPEVQVPAFIIHGTEDVAFPPAHAHALADEIPGARLIMQSCHMSGA